MNTNIDRRSFFKTSALVSLCLISNALLPPLARADNATPIDNIYHVFIPYNLAKHGGKKTITLKNGEDFTFKIPAKIGNEKILKFSGQKEDNDIKIIAHTAYGDSDSVRKEIKKAKFLLNETTINKCEYTYSQIQNGEYVNYSDLALLDYIITSSKLDDSQIQSYQIASDAYKIDLIEKRLNSTLESLNLPTENKKALKATFQYVKALEAIPNFDLLDQLDLIIANEVDIPLELKGLYAQASATSRAYLADLLIRDSLNTDQTIPNWIKKDLISIYSRVINGETIDEEETRYLESLTQFIVNSDLPKNAKIVYLTAVENSNNQLSDEQKNYLIALFENKDKILKVRGAWKNGSAIATNAVPFSAHALTTFGVEAGTGAALSSLGGAAATNATLAALGGGAVSAGGLGMLGGLAVVTGGAALIGAAGILSFAVISQMDSEDYGHLAVAGISGTLAGAGAVGAAWLAASTLGVAGSLSGAASITAIMSALGGLSVMTGGASLVAFGVGFGVWSLLQKNKKRDNSILQELEVVSYALNEEKTNDPIALYIENHLQEQNDIDDFYVSPHIPLKNLTKAVKHYAKNIPFNADEKIVALLDTSMWDDNKQGIILTNQKVIWRATWSSANFKKYEYIYDADAQDIAYSLYSDSDQNKIAQLLLDLKQEKSKLSRA